MASATRGCHYICAIRCIDIAGQPPSAVVFDLPATQARAVVPRLYLRLERDDLISMLRYTQVHSGSRETDHYADYQPAQSDCVFHHAELVCDGSCHHTERQLDRDQLARAGHSYFGSNLFWHHHRWSGAEYDLPSSGSPPQ